MENGSSRLNGRNWNELRPVKITPGYVKHPAGSVLVEFGDTKVLCCASVESKVPGFLYGQNKGWLTAEYSMLPGATNTRCVRESSRGKVGGRTHEIQRLIGRSLRAALDLNALGEQTIWIDCDVIQADGGTRTASITGAWVALVLALDTLRQRQALEQPVLLRSVAAVSVGIRGGELLLDLCYEEDSSCDVDLNIVMTGSGHFIEVQGTAEQDPFSPEQLDGMLDLGKQGIQRLTELQQEALAGIDQSALWRNS